LALQESDQEDSNVMGRWSKAEHEKFIEGK
jgi:hypothetical protein